MYKEEGNPKDVITLYYCVGKDRVSLLCTVYLKQITCLPRFILCKNKEG